MPPVLTEQQLVDITLLSLGNALQKRDSLRFLSETRLMKMVYSVIEDTGLPVTRGWYRYGWYLCGVNARRDRLYQLIGRKATSDPSIESVHRLLSGSAVAFAPKVRREAEDIVRKFAGKTTDAFIRGLYGTEAPAAYRPLYKANWDFMDRNEAVMKSVGQPQLFGQRWEEYSAAVSALHIAISSFPSESTSALVRDHSALLELLVIKEGLLAQEARHEISQFFASVAQQYRDGSWGYPASHILKETVIGPRADAVRSEMEAHMSTISLFRKRLEALVSEAGSRGFLPSGDELSAATKIAEHKLGGRASAAVGDFLAIAGGEVDRSGSSS